MKNIADNVSLKINIRFLHWFPWELLKTFFHILITFKIQGINTGNNKCKNLFPQIFILCTMITLNKEI